jgi:RNA polymerase sigma-70 factor (ECF subfamily)
MSSTSLPAARHSDGLFLTTHWSVVLSAQGQRGVDPGAALEVLCRTYWYPLYAYARRFGHCAADAEDSTQAFFARLLEKDYLKSAAREKGRFRTFLLTAFKRFLANEWDRQHAGKRGGFATIVPIDQHIAETRYASEASHQLAPDVLFDRHWAMTLLEQTMTRLQEEYVATGRAKLFEHLRSCLARNESALAYAEIARQLNLSEPAFKMAVHRVRSRYRDLLREQIAQTVCTPQEIEAEIQHLFSAFEA